MKSLWIEILEEYYRNRRKDRHVLYEEWEDIEREHKAKAVYQFPRNMSTPNMVREIRPPATQGPTIQEQVNKEWEDIRRQAIQLTKTLWETK